MRAGVGEVAGVEPVLDAMAAPVEEDDQREAPFAGERGRPLRDAAADGAAAAAERAVVLGADHDRASVDAGRAPDDAVAERGAGGGVDAGQAVVLTLRQAGQLAELAERAGVDERGDALAPSASHDPWPGPPPRAGRRRWSRSGPPRRAPAIAVHQLRSLPHPSRRRIVTDTDVRVKLR